MRFHKSSIAGLFGILSACSLVATADDPPPKLPKAEKEAKEEVIKSPFRAYLVTDGRFPPVKSPEGKEEPDPRDRTGKIHCLVCENGLAPVIAVFVRGPAATTLPADKGVADLIVKANGMIAQPQYRAYKLAAFVMFLRLEGGTTKEVTVKTLKDKVEVESKVKQDLEFPDEDDIKRQKYADDIKKFATALNAPNVPLGLAADKTKAVAEWGINSGDDGDDVTVVFYYRMRIVKRWTFKSASDLDEKKVDEILKATKDAITGSTK